MTIRQLLEVTHCNLDDEINVDGKVYDDEGNIIGYYTNFDYIEKVDYRDNQLYLKVDLYTV